jgi:hypothetical protein
MHKICEACQFGKQTNNVFPHDKNVSKRALDVVHSDVWGPTKDDINGRTLLLCIIH